ncbi:MAG: hypothetical protein ACREBU_25780, partial [Nitrososphaera sp.]
FLGEYFIEAQVTIPDLKSADSMSISTKSELLGYMVFGEREPGKLDSLKFRNQLGTRHRVRMILDESVLRMNLPGLSSKSHKFITRRSN